MTKRSAGVAWRRLTAGCCQWLRYFAAHSDSVGFGRCRVLVQMVDVVVSKAAANETFKSRRIRKQNNLNWNKSAKYASRPLAVSECDLHSSTGQRIDVNATTLLGNPLNVSNLRNLQLLVAKQWVDQNSYKRLLRRPCQRLHMRWWIVSYKDISGAGQASRLRIIAICSCK